MSLVTRLANAWNVFRSDDLQKADIFEETDSTLTSMYSYSRPDRPILRVTNERGVVNSIYSRIANDVASVSFRHVRVDENEKYLETIKSGLNLCITLSANTDQTARDFWVDVVLSMLDEGVVAVIPVDTSIDISRSGTFDTHTLRTARIIQWRPSSVQVEAYDERDGLKKSIYLPKDKIAILENPFYQVMNHTNATLKRLIRKINILDRDDSKKGSEKLNLLVKFPYPLKSPAQIARAEERRMALESQLENSKYGIGYIDATENVTQLNRAIENDLPLQIKELTTQLYAELGVSREVFEGIATQEQMLIYNNTVLEPILKTIELEFTRKFLTKTAYTQGQRIAYYTDPFRIVPIVQLADIADKMTRNEIMASNEFRSTLGLMASSDPRADQLVNKNMPVEQTHPDGFVEDNQNEVGTEGEYDPLSEFTDEEIELMTDEEIESLYEE